jgi:bifunctional non-homologous end joining protein LigD
MIKMSSYPHNDKEILGMPRLKPMLAGTAPAIFNDEGWLFEIKWDGYRCLSYINNGSVYLDSRNQKPLLPRFPVLKTIQSSIKAHSVLLDGEIVAFCEGRVDFSYLRKQPGQVSLAVFDILFLNGRSMLEVPMKERKDILSQVVMEGGALFISETVEENGTALFDIVKSRNMEGVMAKRLDSWYRPGVRSREWLKIKNVKETVFWIVGYAPGTGRRLASLLIASKVEGFLKVVGRVSSGIDKNWETRLKQLLGEPMEQPSSSVCFGKRLKTGKITWVKPYYGALVRYTERTSDGGLRHPVFSGLL